MDETFFVAPIDPDEAKNLWQEDLAGQEYSFGDVHMSKGIESPLPTNTEAFEKQLIPVVDDVFLSLFLGGRDETKDPISILWKYLLAGRSARIRRPYHAAWAMLRRIAQVNPIVGMCIRFLVQEFRGLQWDVKPIKSGYTELAKIAKILFRFPNPIDNWTTFQDKLLIELLSIDAAPIEVWYGKYIPFHIAYERAKLEKLEKMRERMVNNPEDVALRELNAEIALSAFRLSFLLEVEKDRLPLLQSMFPHSTEVYHDYSLIKESADKLHSELRKSNTFNDDIFYELISEHLEKARLQRREEMKPLNLPLAFNPIPGDQIEVWGDTMLMMLDYAFPYRRVLFENVVGKYTREQLVYLREFNRVDSFYGLSPIEAVLLVAYAYLIAHDVQFRYFTRSNIPAGILVVPGQANVDVLRRRLREMLVSPERIAIITTPPYREGGGGVNWIQLSNVNREIQFTELINWYVRLMVLTFGLQPWEVGVESGSISKRQLRIRPGVMGRMKFLESSFNDMLLIKSFRADPSGIQFYYYGIDVGDFSEEAQMLNQVVFKLLTLDEARVRLGLPPLENGLSDYLFVPSGSGVFIMGKVKKTIDEEVAYDTPEKTVGMWTAIAGGMPKGLEAGGGFPAAPTLLKKAQDLRKSLPTPEEISKVESGLSEKQRAALKAFGKAMAALGVATNPLEGYRLAFRIKEDIAVAKRGEPDWSEWANTLGQYLMAAYNENLRKDLGILFENTLDLRDLVGEPPIG